MLGIWRLQLLREVARRGTLREAAAATNLSASAVSQQLAILAREAELPLLEKRGRRLHLTVAGRALVRHADLITDAILAAESELAEMRSFVSGTIRIAAFPTAARAMMPPLMTSLGEMHPAVHVSLRDLEADESLAALDLDEIDLAIVDDYDGQPATSGLGLDAIEILRDPLYLASAGGGELGQAVRLREQADAVWIMDSEQSRFHAAVQRACRAAGIEPRIRSSCRDFAVITALIEAGVGIGVIPGLALHGERRRLALHHIDPPMSRSVVAVVRAGRRHHPAVASAITELQRFGATYRPPSMA